MSQQLNPCSPLSSSAGGGSAVNLYGLLVLVPILLIQAILVYIFCFSQKSTYNHFLIHFFFFVAKLMNLLLSCFCKLCWPHTVGFCFTSLLLLPCLESACSSSQEHPEGAELHVSVQPLVSIWSSALTLFHSPDLRSFFCPAESTAPPVGQRSQDNANVTIHLLDIE